MKKIIFTITGLLSVLLILAQPANTSTIASWKKYNNNNFKISIQYPPSWRLDTTRENSVFFIFTPSENGNDRFVENLNLIRKDISAYKVTLDQYIEINVTQIKTAVADFKQLSGKYFTWDGIRAYELIYTGKIENVDYTVKWRQWYTLYKGVAHVLTYSSDGEKKDVYDVLSKQVMNTMKIK